MQLDIAANRGRREWTRREQAGRVLWAAARPLFALSPRPAWGVRRALLRLFGARVGRDVHVYPSARFTIPWHVSLGDHVAVGDGAHLYALGPITLGERVTVSQGAHLCAGSHDFRDPAMPLLRPPIAVADDVWICAEAFVGPGVSVGPAAVVGARAVVMRDVAPGSIVAGNPGREVGRR